MNSIGAVFLGPSGSGKSDLTEAFSTIAMTPDRVRANPRDSNDIHYLSKRGFAGILSLLEGQIPMASFGGPLEIKIYRDVATFKVRHEHQVLWRPTRDQERLAKNLELYGPVLWALLENRGNLGWVDELLSETMWFVIILNPWARPLAQVEPAVASDPTSTDGKVLVELLERRNEKPENIQKRVINIAEELSAWQSIASATGKDFRVLEAIGWPYAEHTFPKPDDPGKRVRLGQARRAIIALAKENLTTEDSEIFRSLLKPDLAGHRNGV